MQITRYPALTEPQFLGCASAFVDTLFGELNAAVMYLRKLEGQRKGVAFAFEMSLDHHRYGALIVLDRWATLARAFGPHLAAFDGVLDRVQAAENLLGHVNGVIDASDEYSDELVSACVAGFQSLHVAFEEERKKVERTASLGPMLPEEYTSARRVFLQDLAAR
ncbi:MAG: hypothetical protein WD696_05985 [Bryobacteraceae bacterium]